MMCQDTISKREIYATNAFLKKYFGEKYIFTKGTKEEDICDKCDGYIVDSQGNTIAPIQVKVRNRNAFYFNDIIVRFRRRQEDKMKGTSEIETLFSASKIPMVLAIYLDTNDADNDFEDKQVLNARVLNISKFKEICKRHHLNVIAKNIPKKYLLEYPHNLYIPLKRFSTGWVALFSKELNDLLGEDILYDTSLNRFSELFEENLGQK